MPTTPGSLLARAAAITRLVDTALGRKARQQPSHASVQNQRRLVEHSAVVIHHFCLPPSSPQMVLCVSRQHANVLFAAEFRKFLKLLDIPRYQDTLTIELWLSVMECHRQPPSFLIKRPGWLMTPDEDICLWSSHRSVRKQFSYDNFPLKPMYEIVNSSIREVECIFASLLSLYHFCEESSDRIVDLWVEQLGKPAKQRKERKANGNRRCTSERQRDARHHSRVAKADPGLSRKRLCLATLGWNSMAEQGAAAIYSRLEPPGCSACYVFALNRADAC